MILAAIDLGTVTCRLFVAEVASGIERELVRECTITNLGIGVSQTGVLRQDAIDRVVQCIAGYRAQCDAIAHEYGLDALPLVAVATSAARDAKNSDELVAALAQVGVELNIIPGQREAQLSFLGASSEFPGEAIAVVDVGGGSTEVIFGNALAGVEFAYSFDIGCRRITEMFLPSDPPTANELAQARAYLLESFAAVLEPQLAQRELQRMVAVAGTATSVVSVSEEMAVYDSALVHKTVVSADLLDSVLQRLAALTEEERKQVVGLEPKRAPVIVAGMLILQCVLEVLGQTSFTVSESDILQGIVMASSQEL
ncbi:Ppx/GppA family phosphatase [Anaerotardibacter muris]|uniref:Ppx/GppA phosphatase family protein n=1 Tax=Anaerotardibacter muris TaxID=2941505 RepID=UPI00203F7E89|nr:Ppx/GppA family phosphatase [Anaerotardibacter muris]